MGGDMRIKGALFLFMAGLSVSMLGQTLTDSQALAKAKTLWGMKAYAAVIRVSYTTSLQRCIGFDTSWGTRHDVVCVQGPWEWAFGSVDTVPKRPVDPLDPPVLRVAESVRCLADTSKTTVLGTPMGTDWNSPVGWGEDCQVRFYRALLTVRERERAYFDAILHSFGIWLEPIVQ